MTDTERYQLDKLNSGRDGYYGWQWAVHENNYYSIDGLLNFVKNEQLRKNTKNHSIPDFDHFNQPLLNGIYLTSYLRSLGIEVRCINSLDGNLKETLDLLHLNPILVAISTTFHLIPLSLRNVVSLVRKHAPSSKIVLGGALIHHYSKFQEERVLKNLFETIDPDYFIIEGQGEKTLADLLYKLKNNHPIDTVPNLFYVDNNHSVIRSLIQKEDNSLDSHYIKWSQIEDHLLGNTINFQTSRSCPNRCSFCTFWKLNGRYETKSIDTIIRELNEIKAKGFINNIIFIDDTPNAQKKRFQELCRTIIDYHFNWYSFLRCDKIDEYTIKLMKDSGCKGVCIGFESGDDTVLKNMNKKISVDEYKRGLNLLSKYDINTFGSFIVGFPGETEESIENTYDLIENYGLNFYGINGWTYFPFASIEEKKEQFGIKGSGNVWTHKTMDSAQASQHCKNLFFRIKNATFMPANTNSSDMWAVIYLMSRGFSLTAVKKIYAIYKEFISYNIQETQGPKDSEEKARLIKKLKTMMFDATLT